MGGFPWTKLDHLRFEPFPTRPMSGKGMKIVRVGHTMYAHRPGDAVVYTTGALSKPYAFAPGEWNFIPDVVKALVRLKIIDKKTIEEFEAQMKAAEIRRVARSDMKYLSRDLEKYGLKLTAGQMNRIAKAEKEGKR